MVLLRAMVVDSSLLADIEVSDSYDNVSIKLEGRELENINDNQKVAFGLTKTKVREALEKMGHDGEIYEICYKEEPIDGKDFKAYEKNNWLPVKVLIKAIDSKLQKVEGGRKPILELHEVVNADNDIPMFYQTNFKYETTQVASHTFSSGFEVGLGTSMSVQLGVQGLGGSAGVTTNYNVKIGVTRKKEETHKKSTGYSLSFTIPEGKSVFVLITKAQCRMNLKITYEAEVIGYVMVVYATPYKGHRLWAYRVDTLLKALRRRTKRKITEFIDLTTAESLRIETSNTSIVENVPKG